MTSLMTRDAILYSLLVDSWTGAVDDELATKRGRAFFDALPRHRPWPPETAADSDCNGAAPASTLLNYSGPKSDASTVRTAATARAAAAAGEHYSASGGRGVRSRRALKSGSTQAVLQPSSSRQLWYVAAHPFVAAGTQTGDGVTQPGWSYAATRCVCVQLSAGSAREARRD